MFNPKSSELLEIKPIEDIGIANEEEGDNYNGTYEPEPEPLKQNEIFNTKPKSKNVVLEVEEGVMKPIDMPEEKVKKRGVGKRGKDKKKRVKKPLSEKQLAHLAKMRVKAAEKRTAVALEKRRKLEEVKNKVKKVSFSTPSRKGLKTAIMQEKKNENVKISKSVVHKYSNNPRTGGNGGINPNFQDFFDLMDKYEEHKKAKNEIIRKKEQTLPERLNAKRKSNPHPNRRIPHLQRPAPPITSSNPFDDIFNYKGRI